MRRTETWMKGGGSVPVPDRTTVAVPVVSGAEARAAFSVLESQSCTAWQVMFVVRQAAGDMDAALSEVEAEIAGFHRRNPNSLRFVAGAWSYKDSARGLEGLIRAHSLPHFTVMDVNSRWEPGHLESLLVGKNGKVRTPYYRAGQVYSALTVLDEFSGYDRAITWGAESYLHSEPGQFVMSRTHALRLCQAFRKAGLQVFTKKFYRSYRKRFMRNAECTGKPSLVVGWSREYGKDVLDLRTPRAQILHMRNELKVETMPPELEMKYRKRPDIRANREKMFVKKAKVLTPEEIEAKEIRKGWDKWWGRGIYSMKGKKRKKSWKKPGPKGGTSHAS